MNVINKVKHLFGVHQYYVIKELEFNTRKVGCKLCDKTWGMNDNVKAFIPWDKDLDEIYKNDQPN